MGKKKVYYKVVRQVSGKLYSALHINLNLYGMSVKYKVDNWVCPALDGSKLMVFSDFEEASQFSITRFRDLYECEIINPQRKAPFIESIFSNNFRTNLLKLIEIKKKGKKYFGESANKLGLLDNTGTKPVYKSVVFCDAVKLTKRISI